MQKEINREQTCHNNQQSQLAKTTSAINYIINSTKGLQIQAEVDRQLTTCTKIASSNQDELSKKASINHYTEIIKDVKEQSEKNDKIQRSQEIELTQKKAVLYLYEKLLGLQIVPLDKNCDQFSVKQTTESIEEEPKVLVQKVNRQQLSSKPQSLMIEKRPTSKV